MTAPPVDPCLAFLRRWDATYRKAEASDPDEAVAILRDECRPMDQMVLAGGLPPAATSAGAAEALRRALAADEMDPMDAHLVRAALAFLEAAPGICTALAPDPELAETIAYWRNRDGQMVPVAEGGMCVRLVSHRRIGDVAVPDPLPVADYITGLELLGFRFEVYGPSDARRWGTVMPDPPLPAPWEAHALRLEAAMDRLAHRTEIIAFLLGRNGDIGGAS